MATEMWVSSSVSSDNSNASNNAWVINNPTVIPPVGASMDTPDGLRYVHRLHFDYNEKGDCRVHVYVHRR